MITTIPITKARINLGSIVKRVHLNKERFILEKDGYPVALISNIDEFEDFLEQNNPKVRRHLTRSRNEVKKGAVLNAKEVLRKRKKK